MVATAYSHSVSRTPSIASNIDTYEFIEACVSSVNQSVESNAYDFIVG